MVKIEIKDINFEAKYQGYIWMSDDTQPKLYHNEKIDKTLFESKNPFVIEAQLYDEDNMLSYSMKTVDGKLLINKYEVKEDDFNSEDVKELSFVPNRMEKVEKLKFLQYWTPEKDDYCNGKEVLQPSALVFTGLKLNKEEDKK